MDCSFTKSCLILIVSFSVEFIHADVDDRGNYAKIYRTIDDIGFHRNVNYVIDVYSNELLDLCSVCLQEIIPQGLYVNRDQIHDLQRLGRLNASVVGDVNIEDPSDIAKPHFLRLHIALAAPSLTLGRYKGQSEAPLHHRYHPPQPGGGYQTVRLSSPELYLHCPGAITHGGGVYLTSCSDGNNSPALPFKPLPFTINEKVIQMEVPVGDTDSLTMVQMATFFVTSVGCVYICGVLFQF